MLHILKKNPLGTALLFIVAIIVGLFFLLRDHKTVAASTQDMQGFAWSENIGWISFNSKNCDANEDGLSDGSPAGCPAIGTPIAAYKVSVDMTIGNFSGYAWSEHIGWIKFDPITIPPGEASANPVRLDRDGTACGTINYVCGWARACSAVADKSTCEGATDPASSGWDGWIHTRNGSAYGLTWDEIGGQFYGWMWSDNVLGWISANCANGGGCSASDYKMYTASLPTPTPPPPSISLVAAPDLVIPGDIITITWTNVPAPTVTDWIGLYTPNSPDNPEINGSKIYTSSCTSTPGTVALSSGSCTFTMPDVSGVYEFRLFANDTYIILAVSNPITAQRIDQKTRVIEVPAS